MRNFRVACIFLGLTALGSGGIAACSGGDDDDMTAGEDGGEDAEDDIIDATLDARPDRQRPDADAGEAARDVDSGGGDGDADAPTDGPRKDADAAALPEVGTPCSPSSAIQTQRCGFCGTHDRVCLDRNDSGTPVWQEWGFCQNSVDGGCQPGDTLDASCGNCGHMLLTCNNQCQWPATAVCKDAGPCAPGDMDYHLGLSCDVGGLLRTCGDDCQWGDFGETCIDKPYIQVMIPTTVGAKVTKKLVMPPTPQIPRFETWDYFDECPEFTDLGIDVSYLYVRLVNPNALAANVSIWHSETSSLNYIDSVLAVYDTPLPPPDGDDDARKACQAGTVVCDHCLDTTTDPTACEKNWAGLMKADFDFDDNPKDNSITVPGNSSVWVYNGAWADDEYGEFNLNVYLHALTP